MSLPVSLPSYAAVDAAEAAADAAMAKVEAAVAQGDGNAPAIKAAAQAAIAEFEAALNLTEAASANDKAPAAPKERSALAKLLQRSCYWIPAAVGLVVVITAVALAVIFGVPAPVVGLAQNIWQASGNLANEGLKRLLLLLGKV